MLPKINRLQLRHHQTFFSNAVKKHTRHFVVFVEHTSETTKAAVIVPAKKVPLAVDRVAHKRMIRAALAILIKDQNQLLKSNLVVYCKRRLENTTLTEITSELSKIV